MSYIIRSATNQDAPAIINLMQDIWENENNVKINEVLHYPDLNHIDKIYHQNNGLFLVCIDTHKNKIIGTIAAQELDRIDNSYQFELRRLFVEKPYRKLGIAQKLLDYLTNYYQNNNKNNNQFYLSTCTQFCKAAIKFLIKNQFVPIEREKLPPSFQFFPGDDLYMHKTI